MTYKELLQEAEDLKASRKNAKKIKNMTEEDAKAIVESKADETAQA